MHRGRCLNNRSQSNRFQFNQIRPLVSSGHVTPPLATPLSPSLFIQINWNQFQSIPIINFYQFNCKLLQRCTKFQSAALPNSLLIISGRFRSLLPRCQFSTTIGGFLNKNELLINLKIADKLTLLPRCQFSQHNPATLKVRTLKKNE